MDRRVDLAKLYQNIYGHAAVPKDIHDFGKVKRPSVHQTASDGVNCGPYSLGFAKHMLKADAGKASPRFYNYCKTKLIAPARMRQELASDLHSKTSRVARFKGSAKDKALVADIRGLPRFSSPKGRINGLRSEIDVTRQIMGELAKVVQSKPSKIKMIRMGGRLPLADASGKAIMHRGEQAILKHEDLVGVRDSTKFYASTHCTDKTPPFTGKSFGTDAAKYKEARWKYAISENFLIFDERGQFIPSPDRNVGKTLTAVAPNLTDSRDADLVGPSNKSKRVAHLKTLVEDQVKIFAAEGCKHLVLPAFGCGVFGLDPTEVAGVYKEVLAAQSGSSIEAVHFALPLPSDGSTFDAFKAAFTGYNGEIPVYITEKDATGVIQVLSKQGIAWGELNPGNAETQVGNSWTGASTAYEQSRARNSALIFAQRADLNREYASIAVTDLA